MKPKIAHIANTVGGVDIWLRINLPALPSDEVEAFVIKGIEGKDAPYLNDKGKTISTYQVPIQREISLLKDFKAVLQTVQILKKEKPTAIHAHSAKGGIIARLASLFYKTKVLYTPHAFSYLSAEGSLKQTFFLSIEKVSKHINSVLVACSVSEQKQGIDKVGYKPENTRVYENAIPPISNTPTSLKIPSNKYLCTIGRPCYQKNIEHLVRVIHSLKTKLPTIHLIILGVGEYSPNKQHVEELIRTLHLEDNITLIPWMERQHVFQYIKNAQLYLSAARYEGLPYSVIEALALGKACVVTNCDGNRDVIKNDLNGYVIPQNDVESMANCIFALLEDDEKRKTLEIQAAHYFNQHHTIANKITELTAIYKEFST